LVRLVETIAWTLDNQKLTTVLRTNVTTLRTGNGH
jgi:hypothetical protein